MRVSRNYRAFTKLRDISNGNIDRSTATVGYGDLPLYIKLALFVRFDIPLLSDLIGLIIELPVFLARIIKAIGYDLLEILLAPITLYVYFASGEYSRRNVRRSK